MPSAQDILKSYAGRRVLLTGATGFMGQWVARLLNAAGANLCVSGRDASALHNFCDAHHFASEVFEADLSRSGAFSSLYNFAMPDITLNLAGYGVDRTEQDAALFAAINTRLVQEIAETIAANRAGAWTGLRLVHVGSAFEYGSVAGELTEDSQTNPTSIYGETKLAGTRALLDVQARTGLPATTARLFTVYGPGEHAARLLPSLLRAAQTGEALPLTTGEQQRDFTYVAEVAEGLLRLGMLHQAPGIVNLATGRLASVREFALCAARVLGLRPEQLQFGAIPVRGDEVQQAAVNTRRLEELTGWRPVCTMEEGIRATRDFAARKE
jgi:nucleoside-diphosphate-sugar epimerase